MNATNATQAPAVPQWVPQWVPTGVTGRPPTAVELGVRKNNHTVAGPDGLVHTARGKDRGLMVGDLERIGVPHPLGGDMACSSPHNRRRLP